MTDDEQAEIARIKQDAAKLRAEALMLYAQADRYQAESAKILAEQTKRFVEQANTYRDAWWHPLLVMTAIFAVGAAFGEYFLRR